ncbi:thioredoxin family protein, partial [Salmonella sp. s51228]|uniref:thioredoxin family protein n=1 Tax=Salmonella sp. s51228 TaxID=3159652 RepID=UPI00397F35FA
EEDFDKFIADNPLVAVDFYATWCGPCKMISPKFETFSITYPTVKFLKVDVDKSPSISTKYNITAMPTFKFYMNNVQNGEVVGASEAKIIEELEKLK